MVDDNEELTGMFDDGGQKNLISRLHDCCHHNDHVHSRDTKQTSPIDCQYIIHLYFIDKECGNLSMWEKTPAYQVFVKDVATVYENMISNTHNNDGYKNNNNRNMMGILKEMDVDVDCESLADHKLEWKY